MSSSFPRYSARQPRVARGTSAKPGSRQRKLVQFLASPACSSRACWRKAASNSAAASLGVRSSGSRKFWPHREHWYAIGSPLTHAVTTKRGFSPEFIYRASLGANPFEVLASSARLGIFGAFHLHRIRPAVPAVRSYDSGCSSLKLLSFQIGVPLRRMAFLRNPRPDEPGAISESCPLCLDSCQEAHRVSIHQLHLLQIHHDRRTCGFQTQESPQFWYLVRLHTAT